jgi:hypothetical protein
MTDAPLPPPYKDWQSPEFGEAVRAILDVHEGIRGTGVTSCNHALQGKT